jgi:hypothetical protein
LLSITPISGHTTTFAPDFHHRKNLSRPRDYLITQHRPVIQTVEADGTNRQTVFAPGPRFYPYGPVFSPDGKKMAFGNEREGGHIADPCNIWTVGAHGKNPTYLTRPSAAGRVELRTDWGPRPTG